MDTERLAKLIDAKVATVLKLHELSRRQLVAIANSDFIAVLQLLSGKQQLASQLEQLDAALAPYQQQDPESRRWSSPEQRQRCRLQTERCAAVLREILLLEEQAVTAVQHQREDTAQRLVTMQTAANAQRAYIPAAPPTTTSMFDLTSEG